MPGERKFGGLTEDQIKDRQNHCVVLNTFATDIPDRWPLCKAQCMWTNNSGVDGSCPQAAGSKDVELVVPAEGSVIEHAKAKESEVKTFNPYQSGVVGGGNARIVDYTPGMPEAARPGKLRGMVYRARQLLSATK
jgi:hypothetical protein